MPENQYGAAVLKQRFESLDGLRGLAAIIVVFCHFFSAYMPVMPNWAQFTPLALLFNGSFAVAIFFVLSGFVISSSASKRAMPIIFNVVQRYFRLALPATAGAIFGWILFSLFPHEVSVLKSVQSTQWLIDGTFDNNLPSIWHALTNGMIGIFIQTGSRFNGVLWTMKVELIGSLSIYVFYWLAPVAHRRKSLFAIILILLLGFRLSQYAAFAIGAILQELRKSEHLPNVLTWPALIVGLLIGSATEGFQKFYHIPHPKSYLALGNPQGFWQIIAAYSIIYAVLGSNSLTRILESKPVKFMGDISFGLYLVHWPLLFTIFVPMFVVVHQSFIGMAALLAAFFATCLALGYVFTQAVDKPTMNAIHASKKWYIRLRERKSAASSLAA